MEKEIFKPKLFSLIKNGEMNSKQIKTDISAGIIVGILALPLAIAFGIASGVSPEKGIITAIIAGFAVSVLGGSRVQIAGPTGAFVVMVASVIHRYGFEGMLLATIMAGVLLVIMGLFKLGNLFKFLPLTLVTGFTSGIALIIFTTQIGDFLGITKVGVSSDFLSQWAFYLGHLNHFNLWAIVLGALTIVILVIIPKFQQKIPAPFIAIVILTLVSSIFKLPVETIGSRFGTLSNQFEFSMSFAIDPEIISSLILPAVSIAILGALESLLSAIVADGMIGDKHNSNTELIAQGIANIITPFFGGIPATGAIARTAVNVKNQGRTPVAGIVHALVVFVVFLSAMPVIAYIPMAVLAGVLMVTAWNMSEIHVVIQTFRINWYESLILVTTFLLTLLTDLTIAIPTGFILSCLLFIKRMAESVDITPLTYEKTDGESLFHVELGRISKSIHIYEINGPLFFASAHHFYQLEKQSHSRSPVYILRLRYVPIIDSMGLKRLKEIIHYWQSGHSRVFISGANDRIKSKLARMDILPESQIYSDIKDALAEAHLWLEKNQLR
ncbi:MAG: STAS domain-containing protein [Spirochaetales bacterium]|nr:STAS domain-containing protein [Spirochaetales bacterium]